MHPPVTQEFYTSGDNKNNKIDKVSVFLDDNLSIC